MKDFIETISEIQEDLIIKYSKQYLKKKKDLDKILITCNLVLQFKEDLKEYFYKYLIINQLESIYDIHRYSYSYKKNSKTDLVEIINDKLNEYRKKYKKANLSKRTQINNDYIIYKEVVEGWFGGYIRYNKQKRCYVLKTRKNFYKI